MSERGLSSFAAALAIVCAMSASASAGPAPDPDPGPPPPAPLLSICDAIAKVATDKGLPVDYLTRIIWQESAFDARAQSPAGAQGIAQFMPQTAAFRGLADPFSVSDALPHAAAYLADLRAAFGNLGLAAAAYNAGPGRVSRWQAGQGELPQETRAYVLIVTGHPIEDWITKTPPVWPRDAQFSCARYATLRRVAPVRLSSAPGARRRNWAVILLGNPQRDKLVAEYQTLRGTFSQVLGGYQPSIVHKRIGGLEIARFIAQIEQDTRGAADALCGRLKRAGGFCIVLANR